MTAPAQAARHSTDLDGLLQAEQLRLHQRSAPIAVASAALLALLLVVLVGDELPTRWVAAWSAAIALALGLRTAVVVSAQRGAARGPQPASTLLWRYRATFCVHGLAWAVAALALPHLAQEGARDLMVLALVGICASSMLVASFDPRSVLLFSGPPLLAVLAVLFASGRPSSGVMALMFVALTLLGMQRAHASLLESLRLRRADQVLAARNGRLALLAQRTVQGFLFTDAAGAVLQANPALCALLGRSEDQLIARGLDAVLEPAALHGLRALLERAARDGSADTEIELRRPDGSPATASVVATALGAGDDGHPAGAVTVWTDITERRRIERDLRMYQVVANSITDLVSVIDADRVYRLVNDSWCQATGLSREQAVGRSVLQVPAASSHDQRMQAIDDCLRLQERRVVRSVLDLPGLTQRHVETTYFPYADVEQGARSVVLVSRDVTGEVQALLATQRHDAELRALLDAFPGHIAAIDDSQHYVYINQRQAQAHGRRPEDVIGQPLAQVLSPRRLAVVQAEFEGLKSGVPVVTEIRLPAGRGRPETDLQLTHVAGPVGPDGRRVYYSFGIDITDRTRAEAALRSAKDEAERANRAKSMFLSQMSHELRTPMNAILGFGQLLAAEGGRRLDDAQRGWVREILRGGHHLLNLINEVLDLGRVEAGRLPLSLEPVALADLVDECLSLARPLAAERTVQLPPAGCCPPQHAVQADRTRLKQVLLNLLGNAIKYNNAGGQVRVSFAADGAVLRIAVHDTGPGLSPEQCARLFKPYERLDADGSVVEGSGIGLALSQGLVHAMGGQIGVDSTPGQGSTFWLTLAQAARPEVPVLPLPLTAAREGAAAAGPGQPRLVLYIEDNPVNAMLMEAMLQPLPGIRLLVSAQANEGLELARQLHPALVLTDIQMPDVDGFEVLRRLRADDGTRAIPVLAVSANAMPEDVARSLAAGFDAYLTKPLDMPALHAAVRKALALEASVTDG